MALTVFCGRPSAVPQFRATKRSEESSWLVAASAATIAVQRTTTASHLTGQAKPRTAGTGRTGECKVVRFYLRMIGPGMRLGSKCFLVATAGSAISTAKLRRPHGKNPDRSFHGPPDRLGRLLRLRCRWVNQGPGRDSSGVGSGFAASRPGFFQPSAVSRSTVWSASRPESYPRKKEPAPFNSAGSAIWFSPGYERAAGLSFAESRIAVRMLCGTCSKQNGSIE